MVRIHQRVHERHPELDDGDVEAAWESYRFAAVRIPGECEMRTGYDPRGRYIEMVGLHGFEQAYPHQISGGMAQRVAIARAVVRQPKILIADEPTGNLDPETSGQILQLLHDISRRGTSVVMTTHNYTLVHNYPARIVKCENGLLCDLNSDKEGE